ncbi:MAG: ferritin-like domain-containing protein [Pirellulales bacterium]
MTRYEEILQILDESVGGPNAPVGFHGAFWRGLTRDDFVAQKVFGMPLVIVGNGADSNLVKALKGQTPFGADSGNPEADFNRMPSGRAPVSDFAIAVIERWINEGCPEEDIVSDRTFTWSPTNAPIASSRTDDIWFLDEFTGWAVNSDGTIIKTSDGGETWTVQLSAPGVYLRCIGFADAENGWVGTLSRNRRLFHTSNGGATWARVTNLPARAPVAICGISVVNSQVVFGAGTNRPEDSPAMIKTVDGGATWEAIDMSAHASILIDVFFTDPSHGWVVGGKAEESTPTTRDKVKPVVLETNDGGVTWVNRIANLDSELPLGEWGWKIQFLDRQLGFVSLENFSAGAILKTTDGGRTWRRITVNDPQGNKNLEGVGFLDENVGWVGGWGSDFSPPGPTGFSSSTTDGGATWKNANEIGLRINRFRFLGSPLRVGYASGFSVYKYASGQALTSSRTRVASLVAPRLLLCDPQISAESFPVAIPLDIPVGARRMTLHVWDRFGVDHGTILDEVRPESGRQVYEWDGVDDRGRPVGPGDYILRLTVDDASASSTLSCRPRPKIEVSPSKRLPIRETRSPVARPQRPRLTTIQQLVEAPVHDMEWLRNALQIAIQMELATLPPYLIARWTVKDPTDPVAESIFEIRGEEMLHFGLACNLLSAIGGIPLLADETVVPKYPGRLPGGVRPALTVTLRKLDCDQAAVFMDIEHPQGDPLGAVATAPTTIGEFYTAIRDALGANNPAFDVSRQIERSLPFGHLFKIDSLAKAQQAIDLITLQGEGTSTSPEENNGDLAHYYRFGEIYHKRRFVKNEQGEWGYFGDAFPLPAVHDMADIPAGGYQQSDVPDMAVWDAVVRFDRTYSEMLRKLQETWTNGTTNSLFRAVSLMSSLQSIAAELIAKPRPDGVGNYGPCFRYVP